MLNKWEWASPGIAANPRSQWPHLSDAEPVIRNTWYLPPGLSVQGESGSRLWPEPLQAGHSPWGRTTNIGLSRSQISTPYPCPGNANLHQWREKKLIWFKGLGLNFLSQTLVLPGPLARGCVELEACFCFRVDLCASWVSSGSWELLRARLLSLCLPRCLFWPQAVPLTVFCVPSPSQGPRTFLQGLVLVSTQDWKPGAFQAPSWPVWFLRGIMVVLPVVASHIQL